MAKRVLTDEKIQARKLYVENGITSFTDLATHVGVSRQTIAGWAKEEAWSSQRTSTVTSAGNIAKRMLILLEQTVAEIEEKQANGSPVAPKVFKDMLDQLKGLRMIDSGYDEKSATIDLTKKLVQYLSTLPHERELLKGLKRVVPGFFAYMEK